MFIYQEMSRLILMIVILKTCMVAEYRVSHWGRHLLVWGCDCEHLCIIGRLYMYVLRLITSALTAKNVLFETFVSECNIVVVPYGDDSDGYYNVMTSTEQQQQQQQPHSPAAGESYRGVVSGTATSNMSTPVTTVAASAVDNEPPNDRELNLTTAAAPSALIQWCVLHRVPTKWDSRVILNISYICKSIAMKFSMWYPDDLSHWTRT